MKHLKNIKDIEQTIADNRLCLFYIKAPDCGVCNVMLDKVVRLADLFPSLTSFYTDITEEPLIAGQFLVYSGPTVLLLLDGKEVYRGALFIDLEELDYNIKWRTQDEIRTVVNAVLGECIWNLSFNERRMAIELELTKYMEEEEVDMLINHFSVPADYDGLGSKGTRFVFYM